MQHVLESELGGLEEVPVPRPRRELGSTISAGQERVRAQTLRPGPLPADAGPLLTLSM